MGVFVVKIHEAEKCLRCKKEIPEDTTVLRIRVGVTREIICQDCVQILWKNVEVRNKLNKEKRDDKNH